MIEYYITTADECHVRTELEMDFLDGAPQAERPWLAWAFLKLDIAEGTLPDADTIKKLEAVTTLLNTRLSQELDVVSVGHKYEDGWVELYYYGPTAKKFQAVVSEVIGSQYIMDIGSTRDAKWEHYLYTLYPDPLMLQQIQTRQVLDALSEAGDDFSKEREVEHYLGFLTEGHAKRVSEELYLHGFEEKTLGYNSSEEYGNTLVMTQTHTLDKELLEELAFLLMTTAEKEHGIYVGWSSEVAL